MAAIPQVTRDRLASSVVGTPGIDTSVQKSDNALAEVGQTIGQVAGQALIERQQQLDVAEQNKLSVDYKMSTLNGLEKIKQDYAAEPEKAGPAFMQLMKDNLASTQKQASNPRVGLMVGRGDPYFDTHVIGEQQSWAYKQRNALNVTTIENQGNQIAAKAEDLGRTAPTYLQMMNDLKPLASATGNLIAGASKAVSVESALKLQQKMLPTLYSRAFYGSLQDNPARAYAMTQDKDVQAAFATHPKELDAMSQQAMQRVQGMAKQEEWKQIITPLIDSPQIIHQVANGQVDWNQIQKFPDGPFKEQLQKMALAGPSINTTEKAEATANFFADAADMGMNRKISGADKSTSELVRFNTELLAAHNDGLITPATYQKMLNKLAVPLRDSVLKVHDPDTLREMKKTGGFFGWGAHTEEPDQAIDKYVGGYNQINSWLKSQGKDQDWQAKSDIIKKYMDFSDSIKPEDRDFYGRAWTPQNVARKVMGIGDGDTIQTIFGPKQITGATANGMPKYEITKEEQDKLNHMAQLNGTK